MVVLFQQYIEIYAFSPIFSLVGSVIGGFYWLFLWNFKEIKHQLFSMTQPFKKIPQQIPQKKKDIAGCYCASLDSAFRTAGIKNPALAVSVSAGFWFLPFGLFKPPVLRLYHQRPSKSRLTLLSPPLLAYCLYVFVTPLP